MPKKRIPDESFSSSYWFLRLDRRDIEQIVDTIGGPTTLASEGYEYASVAELAEHFGSRRPKEIEIKGRIHVRIRPGYTSLFTGYSASDDEKKDAIACAVSIDRLLKSRALMSFSTWVAVYGSVAAGALMSFLAWNSGRGTPFLVGWALLVLACLWLYFLKGVVTLTAEHKPFLQRHQEAIVTAVVTVVLTLSGTALYDWLKGK